MATWLWPHSIITRVLDGDTIDVLVSRDIGFGGHVVLPIRLRLNRINAPELATADGRASAATVDRLLPVGDPFDIETIQPYKFGGPADADGEWMAEVTLPDGTNLSDVLVAGGFAVYWNGEGPRPHDGGPGPRH